MDSLISTTQEADLRGQLLKNHSLAHYTSWRAGGPAEYVYLPADLKDLSTFLSYLPENIPLTWLGLGSNTLVRDGGVEGIVIITQGKLNQLASDDVATLLSTKP